MTEDPEPDPDYDPRRMPDHTSTIVMYLVNAIVIGMRDCLT